VAADLRLRRSADNVAAPFAPVVNVSQAGFVGAVTVRELFSGSEVVIE
jgi:hypothetical protein